MGRAASEDDGCSARRTRCPGSRKSEGGGSARKWTGESNGFSGAAPASEFGNAAKWRTPSTSCDAASESMSLSCYSPEVHASGGSGGQKCRRMGHGGWFKRARQERPRPRRPHPAAKRWALWDQSSPRRAAHGHRDLDVRFPHIDLRRVDQCSTKSDRVAPSSRVEPNRCLASGLDVSTPGTRATQMRGHRALLGRRGGSSSFRGVVKRAVERGVGKGRLLTSPLDLLAMDLEFPEQSNIGPREESANRVGTSRFGLWCRLPCRGR